MQQLVNGKVTSANEGLLAAGASTLDAERSATAPESPLAAHSTIELPAQPEATILPTEPPRREGYHGWTIVLLAIGIGLIACCLLLPQADDNRKLLYQCETLKVDLDHLEKQVEINDEFIKRVGNDRALAERLALRQMNCIRRGSTVLDLKQTGSTAERSPFSLVTIPPPPPMPEYKPVGGRLAELCRGPRNRLRMIGAGLILMAAGLVLGPATCKFQPA